MRKRNLSIVTAFICCLLKMTVLSAFNSDMPQQPFSTDQAIVLPFTSSNEEIVSVKMFNEDKAVRPGKTFWTCFQFSMASDWHLYWENPGDVGAAPTILWTLPEGFTVGEPLWPFPERYEIDGAVVYGYEKQVMVLVPIVAPVDLLDGERVSIKAEVQWLACARTCVPGNAFFSFQLPVSTRSAQVNLSAVPLFRQARRWLPVEAKNSRAVYDKGIFEVEVFPNVPLEEIHNVSFFLEEKELLNTHIVPIWQVSDDGKQFVMQVKDDNLSGMQLPFPLKAVLVVKDGKKGALKNHAWQVSITPGAIEKQITQINYVKKVPVIERKAVEHIESLEKQIWYRKVLDSLTAISQSDFMKILFLAFVGGILLNVMPCVLPVISMKMLQLVELKNEKKVHIAKHALSYCLGVLVAFWVLAALIFVLQSVGQTVGWGFQLQEPLFVASLVLVLFILGLGLFGVFEFGITLSSKAAGIQDAIRANKTSSTTSFLSGVLATFVATPCTGPLLGSAIGFAAGVQPVFAFLIFSSLGLGMAFPFILLAFIPGVHKLIPRPGQWMVTFKELMGFFMMATVLWLIWVLDAETTGLSLLTMLITLLIVGLGTWVYGTWARFDRPKNTKIIASIIAAAVIFFGAYMLLSDVQATRGFKNHKSEKRVVESTSWQTFSKARLERLLEKKIPVFVAVSAKWCLTCHANHAILDMDSVEAAFKRYGVVKMIADWTNGDEEITKYLREHGRNGVPMYVVYSRDSDIQPVVLPELLTPELVISAVRDAAIPK